MVSSSQFQTHSIHTTRTVAEIFLNHATIALIQTILNRVYKFSIALETILNIITELSFPHILDRPSLDYENLIPLCYSSVKL